nr:gliding motility protein GldN [Saprospiraceae bacterium]
MLNNFFRYSLLVIFAASYACLGFAQQPGDIITESSAPVEEHFLDGVVERTNMHESQILDYPPMREADVPWERTIWRVIDVREKINAPFINPIRPLVSILIDGAESGELTVFDNDEFLNALSPEDVSAQLFRIDTNRVIDPETYEEDIVITESTVDPLSIQRYRIKEVWYFNSNTSRLGVRILGLSPLRDVYSEQTGEFMFEIPMFWVYYPQARELLGRERAFVTGNDAAPMTWYDLMEMRRFSSYVFKASNVYDERISAFFEDPIDQLIESQKIEDELFNFEMDFWSY